MAKKADAWNDFGKAAIVAETLKVIPTVMKEINHPLTWGQLSSIKVVNNCNGEAGASKVTEDSINIASQLPKLVRALTGVDMEQTMLAIDWYFEMYDEELLYAKCIEKNLNIYVS